MIQNYNLLYLNRNGNWVGWQRQGLALDANGALSLAARPAIDGDPRPGLAQLPAPRFAAGLVVTPDGSLIWTDPDHDRIYKLESCDGSQAPMPCLGGTGDHPTRFHSPRGLAFHPVRRALFVADSGNHRLQFFDLESLQWLGTWGERGSEPGQFESPTALACDADGNLYVVDEGNRRVEKFNVRGEVDESFEHEAARTAADNSQALSEPAAVAVSADSNEIHVLDRASASVLIFDTAGAYRARIDCHLPPTAGSTPPPALDLMGLAASSTAVYVGDNRGRRVYQFNRDGSFGGEALGYDGPVAALALDSRGNLWVLPGGVGAPVRLSLSLGFVRDGSAWGGPFKNPALHPEQWHWLRGRVSGLGPGSHLQLYVYRSLSRRPPAPASPPWSGGYVDFDERLQEPLDFTAYRDRWVRLPLDAASSLFPGAPLEYLWIGLELSGEGRASPAVSQLELEFDHPLYLRHLPAAFGEDDAARHFGARFLTLFESEFDEAERETAMLPALFDPAAVPSAFLPWLAGWLASTLPGDWDETRQRTALAGTFASYAERGTPRGLRAAVRQSTGVEIQILEPILAAHWWVLAGDETPRSCDPGLGFTMLAPAEAGPPVLGSTAVLDRAHLIGGDETGEPLLEEVAHQFTVLLYRSPGFGPDRERQVRDVLDREKPAHVSYQLCLVEPDLRLGYQSLLGVDTIIGRGPVPAGGIALAGQPPAQIGERTRLGRETELG